MSMEYPSEKVKRIITDIVDLAVKNGEPNFRINAWGDKSTIQSEQGHIVAQQCTIRQISLFIDLEDLTADDCEDDE